MRKILSLALLCATILSSCNRAEDSYVVLISKAVENDTAWIGVANNLSMKHDAEIVVYEESPRDVFAYHLFFGSTLARLNASIISYALWARIRAIRMP